MSRPTYLAFSEILGELVLADAIYYRLGNDVRLLWARTPAEIESRGDTLEPVHFTLECRNSVEVDSFKRTVRRLKYLDRE
jgi:hypothetical protein